MLNRKQITAAYELENNVILSASPGTGKTRTLVARAANKLGKLPDSRSLALITYTNAAADEIANRLVTDKTIFIGTIHRFCLEFILRPFSWIYKWPKPRIVTFDELQCFIESSDDINIGSSPIDELNRIKKDLKGKIVDIEDWAHVSPLRHVSEQYFAYLAGIKAIDFNELLFRSYKIISENKYIAVSLANRFFEILIDEFQDTNIFQYEIFKLIYRAGPSTFFMVGDQRQRIYRFAGAIDNAFSSAKGDFKAHADLLNITYRSTDNIVKAYCSLFEDHPKLQNDSQNKKLGYKIAFFKTDQSNYGNVITQCISKLVEAKIPLSNIAILSARWTDSLNASRSLRTIFNVVGLGALPHSTRNLNNSTFQLLRVISRFHYSPSVSRLRAIKRAIELHALEHSLSIDDKTLLSIQNTIISRFQKLEFNKPMDLALSDFSISLAEVFGINHSTIEDIIQRIDSNELAFWTAEKYFKTLSGVDGITINTIHQAKGLEYDAVILDQMNVGRIPFQIWDRVNRLYLPATQESITDGRNLFYVAVSRAKKILIILHNWNASMFVSQLRNV